MQKNGLLILIISLILILVLTVSSLALEENLWRMIEEGQHLEKSQKEVLNMESIYFSMGQESIKIGTNFISF